MSELLVVGKSVINVDAFDKVTGKATVRLRNAEAPTGSGKTLAYLCPVVTSGAKTVVATATLALQDQLWRSDIPLVERSGGTARAALLKGRGQYLCRAKLDVALGGDALFDVRPHAEFNDEIARLDEFAHACTTGDLSEVEAQCGPISNLAIDAVSCSAGECPGASVVSIAATSASRCSHVSVADAADVLVVNHALYCAHLASDGQVLPDHDVVVFDEAHALADIAAAALGADLSPRAPLTCESVAPCGRGRLVTDGISQQAEVLERLFAEIDGRVVDPGRRAHRRAQQRGAADRGCFRRGAEGRREHRGRAGGQARRCPSRHAGPHGESGRGRRRLGRGTSHDADRAGRSRCADGEAALLPSNRRAVVGHHGCRGAFRAAGETRRTRSRPPAHRRSEASRSRVSVAASRVAVRLPGAGTAVRPAGASRAERRRLA